MAEFVEIDEEFERGDVGEVKEVPVDAATVPVDAVVTAAGYK